MHFQLPPIRRKSDSILKIRLAKYASLMPNGAQNLLSIVVAGDYLTRIEVRFQKRRKVK